MTHVHSVGSKAALWLCKQKPDTGPTLQTENCEVSTTVESLIKDTLNKGHNRKNTSLQRNRFKVKFTFLLYIFTSKGRTTSLYRGLVPTCPRFHCILCIPTVYCAYPLYTVHTHCIPLQGEENLDNDFYLKEAPDGTVLFESVPNKGRYIQVTMKNKKNVTIVRNFSIVVLVGPSLLSGYVV